MKTFLQSIIDTILGPSKPLKPAKEVIPQRLVQVEDLPDFMQGYDRLRGVYVGGCIGDPTGKWDKSHTAHAHTHGQWQGYICFMNERKFRSHLLLKHELSHILSRSGHTKAWAAVYVSLKNPTNQWLTMDFLKQKYKFGKKKKDTKDAIISVINPANKS